jgi:hypothetical protein
MVSLTAEGESGCWSRSLVSEPQNECILSSDLTDVVEVLLQEALMDWIR